MNTDLEGKTYIAQQRQHTSAQIVHQCVSLKGEFGQTIYHPEPSYSEIHSLIRQIFLKPFPSI